ncbi:hypothetical protein FXE96_13920 [Vibrio cholerae]|uniref:hypothetical protein n=1 Tax=Vibrio cholerae TaxID=666 RepID=UPI0011DA74BD|nr:hypothetical protein [Vibrio cholerae]TXX75632.1 hypothetical protein FXE96_13920 [Vibrio cholerae]GIA23864.1 hypothetical protein VCSRO130_0435 [Vibrio cholerae]
MRSSISKYLGVLRDHQVTTHGVGARHIDSPLLLGGGQYLDNCTKLELSLSADELDLAFDCLSLPQHWTEIKNHLGSLRFLELWRGLETLRTGHRLRMYVDTITERHTQMSEEEFEDWLDSRRLPKPWFEIYYVTTAEQYRFIWQALFNAAYHPSRRALRIYVPSLNSWNNHLKQILLFNLLAAGVSREKVSHQLLIWTGQTASMSRILLADKALRELTPSIQKQKSGEMAV